jgi:hypothetical protein
MNSKMIRTMVLSLALVLSGCAATVNKSGPPQPPLTVEASAAKSIALQVQAAPGMPAAGHWETLKADWKDGIAIAAGNSGKRVSWVEGDASLGSEPAVLVVVKVRNYVYMTPESRIGMGVFAGNAHVNAEVEFYELPARKLLGTRVYGSSTSAMEGIFSATTRQQVLAISKEIVAEVR